VLRVNKFFRVYESEEERRLYGRGRSSIERVNSRLEEQVCLDRHRVRELRNIAVHVALCIIAMLLWLWLSYVWGYLRRLGQQPRSDGEKH
jgi:hypothetical protein